MPYPRLLRQLLGLLMCLNSFMVSAGPVDCSSRPITLGFFPFGYGYYEENGVGKGTFKDIADELVKRTGCSSVTQVMPLARIWEDLANGHLDINIGGIQTDERDRVAWFFPYLTAKYSTFLRISIAGSVRNADDFIGQTTLRFGFVRNGAAGKKNGLWLDKMREAGRLEESANYETLFEKLEKGRIDGLFASPSVSRKYIKDLHLEGQMVVQEWFPDDPGVLAGLMLSRKRFSEAEATRWGALIQQKRRDGTLKRIFESHMPVAEARKQLDF
jgi:polar amino acid transport system substrate-binding protein